MYKNRRAFRVQMGDIFAVTYHHFQSWSYKFRVHYFFLSLSHAVSEQSTMRLLLSSILPALNHARVVVTLTSSHIYHSSNIPRAISRNCFAYTWRWESKATPPSSLRRVRRFSSRVNTITRVSYHHIFHSDSSSPTLCTNRIMNRFKSRLVYSSARTEEGL